jgi:hypothetical protein
LVRAYALKVEFGLATRETDMMGRAPSIRDATACRALLSNYLAQQIRQKFSSEKEKQSSAKLDADEDEHLADFLDSCHRKGEGCRQSVNQTFSF